MKLNTLSVSLFGLALFGCTSAKYDTSANQNVDDLQPSTEPGGEPSGEPSGEPGNEPGDEPVWQPFNGHWTYGDGELIESTCPEDDGGETSTDPIGFTLTSNSENEIEIIADGGTDSVVCVLNNLDFTCQNSTTDVTLPTDLGFDIYLEVLTESNGFFIDDSSMTTLFTVTSTCSSVEGNFFGYTCSDIDDLPCVVRFSAEATADQ